MKAHVLASKDHDRITAGLPFVEALARRMAASMPHSIDRGDLVQDGMIGLIDAAHRFDESRGIKFETFAERRVRGAMIDALRRDAWPRGIRRVRRELEAAREKLRHELGSEPSLADLAELMGSDETRLGRTIVRINTIESTSPLATVDSVTAANLPPVMVPLERPTPDKVCEDGEVSARIREAIKGLPWRERKVIGLYYYGDVTMKEIGCEIGVNESRVSQLHARAVQRLRGSLGRDLNSTEVAPVVKKPAKPSRAKRPVLQMAKARLNTADRRMGAATQTVAEPDGGVVMAYRKPKPARARARVSATVAESRARRHA
jgi:RNA polymerase sigma factor for flagellar operon FliA